VTTRVWCGVDRGIQLFMEQSAGLAPRGVFKISITPGASQLRRIRARLRENLATERGVRPGHVTDVELVANELIGAAFEAGIRKPLTLRVELLARLTSVRVRCPGNVELRDEPFGLRERVLQHVAFAWGRRTYRDGSVDLWAEIARPVG
jgi:hypothetical protein